MKKVYATTVMLYLMVMVFFAVFNWGIFVEILNVNMGFITYQMPLVGLLLLLGLIFILMQWMVYGFSNFKYQKNMVMKDKEILSLKDNQIKGVSGQFESLSNNLELLSNKVDSLSRQVNPDPPANRIMGVS